MNGTGPHRVCFPFVGDRVGGSHISALHLIQHLDRSRYQPVVALSQPDGPVAALLDEAGVAYEPGPTTETLSLKAERGSLGYLGRDLVTGLKSLMPTIRFLRERGIELVHTNDGRIHSSWIVPSKLAGCKVVWHHRATPESRGVQLLAPWLADCIASVSHFALPKSWLISKLGRTKVIRSPFDTNVDGIDRGVCRERLLKELQADDDTVVIGYFGSLVARKRPLVFVKTIAALRRAVPDLKVMAPLFGEGRDGMDQAVLAEADRLGVADSVRVMGFRYPGQEWMAACDVLLVTAVDEPFGRTLIEAMLMETLVVATRSGGNVEAIDDGGNGALAAPDRPDELAARLQQVLDDPALMATLRANAKTYALDHFGLARHAEIVMAAYDQLLDKRQRKPGYSPPLAADPSG